jgi:predicted dehydrogenase
MKALFFGLGGAGQRHLRNLRTLRPEAEIAAVRHTGRRFVIGSDLKADFSADVAVKYGVKELKTIAEGLSFKPDFAVVASPSSRHVETCVALLEAGIPVFVEKPASVNRAGLDKLVGLARKKPLMVGYHLRFHPCVKRLRELIDTKRVGRVQSVEVAVHSHMPSWHGYEKPDSFYAGRKDLGGGVVLTEIHEIDLLAWLFGLPTRVTAFRGNASDLGLDVEDTVGAVLEQKDAGRIFPVTLMLSFMQRPPARRFAVNGSEGRIVMDIPRLTVAVESVTGATDLFQVPDFDRNTIFIEELSHFLDCVESGEEPSASIASVAPGERTALAILESLSSGTAARP